MWQKLLDIDHQLLVAINQMGTASQDAFWLYITNAMNWIPFFMVLLYTCFRFFPKRQAGQILLFTLLTLFTTVLLTNGTKELVARLRPIHTEELVPFLRIVTPEEGFSFFSGHTSNSFAICTFLYLVYRERMRWAWWVYIWAVPYALSRLYLGVHFPLDVFVGMCVGISVACLFFYWYKKRELRYQNTISTE